MTREEIHITAEAAMTDCLRGGGTLLAVLDRAAVREG